MSHYSLLVLSEALEHVDYQMTPFYEGPSEEYTRFVPAAESKAALKKMYHEVKSEFGYTSMDEFLRKYYGYTFCEESQAYGRYTNPDGKWDWYTQGGAWSGLLKLKPDAVKDYEPLVVEGEACPGHANQAKLKDLDFSADPDAYAHALRFWEINVEGMPLQESEKKDDFYCLLKPEYYLAQYNSKEEFAQSEAAFTTWALLTPEGEWYQQGEMGFFGMSDATKESRQAYKKHFQEVLEQADPELYATIVDCHT